MRNGSTKLLLLALALIGAASVTKVVYLKPELLPGPLKKLGNAVIDATGVTSVEASSNIEAVYVFVVSLLALVVVLAATRFIWVSFSCRRMR